MNFFDLLGVLITIAAILAYVNAAYVKLPPTIGLMALAIGFSCVLLGIRHLGLVSADTIHAFIGPINFSATVLGGILGALLFAGGLHVDLEELIKHRVLVGILSTFGVVASTAIVGLMTWSCLRWLGWTVGLIPCLLFGALISPTDPVAVLGILKSTHAPKSLEAVMAGESLFNDGIGVVLFTTLIGVANYPSIFSISLFAIQEIGGGIALGLLYGFITYRLCKSANQHHVEVMITLALVTGGYNLAFALHTSGPLAMVSAGLFLSSRGQRFKMPENTMLYLKQFWELIDQLLNAVLFIMLGLETLRISFSKSLVVASLLTIAIVLFGRIVTVGIPVTLLERRLMLPRYGGLALTWGGLRGGLSVAMALTLPESEFRDVFVSLTFAIVVFSILVQGLTFDGLLNKINKVSIGL